MAHHLDTALSVHGEHESVTRSGPLRESSPTQQTNIPRPPLEESFPTHPCSLRSRVRSLVQTTRMTPQECKAKWSNESGNERQTCQEHLRDLCALPQQPTPSAAADREDLTYIFERAVWVANGWTDDPGKTSKDDLLARLLARNHQ